MIAVGCCFFKNTARELEAQAATIDATDFDFKAVNPNTVARFDAHSLAEFIQNIESNGMVVSQALFRLSALVALKWVNAVYCTTRVERFPKFPELPVNTLSGINPEMAVFEG
jgi:hypothetical protein